MEKKNILVCDNKKVFMKMFKRKFGNEFDFTDNATLDQNERNVLNFDRLVFVVYNKLELIEFLKLHKKEKNILVCIFNKNLYTALTFLEDFSDLVLLDGSKTRKEIMADVRSNFESTLSSKKQILEYVYSNMNEQKKQTYSTLKNLIMFSVA